MYNAFFGFQKDPFASTPDPEFFFRSSHHEAALKGLQLSIEARMGLISLVGDEGTGKTVVLECLRNSLGPDIPCAFVRDSRLSFGGFLETIASDLDLDLRFKTKATLQIFLAFTRFVTQQARSGRTVVLIVDEAHNLPANVFYEIVHTTSQQHDKIKAIQTVFAGRPELQTRLADLNPESVGQRAILSRSLHPFTARETQEYIEFRLACAGMPKQTVFPRKALLEIYDRTQGLAPAIHTVCDKLLLSAFSATSKVCTREIRDQVFKKPHRNISQIMADASMVMGRARIDPSIFASPPAPEPPPMQTALLRLAVGARLGSLRPWQASIGERPAHLEAIKPSLVFPRGKFALTVGEFSVGPIQQMPPANSTRALVLRSTMGGSAISYIPIAGVSPRLPKAAAEGLLSGALQPPAYKLIPLEDYVRLAPSLAGVPSLTGVPSPLGPFSEIIPQALRPIGPKPSLQPAAVIPCSYVPLAWNRVTKADWAACANAGPLPVTSIPQTIYPSADLHSASIIPCSHIPLAPFGTSKSDRLDCDTVNADPSPATTIPLPMYPTAGLQSAGVIPCSLVPLASLRATKHAAPPSRSSQFAQAEPANIISDGRPIAAVPSFSLNPSAGGPITLLPLAFSAQPIPPQVETPIGDVSNAPPSLYARPPKLRLKPIDPPQPSFLSPATWIPRVANFKIPWESPADKFAGTRKRLASQPKALMAFVVPIVAALALYGAPPAMRVAADASRQGWQRAQRAVVNRAAVVLDEDFRSGLNDWTNRGGSRPSWTSDAAGFVHPGALALYRPSQGMADYQMQFVGTIDKAGLSWVARAADFNNYYAIRLTVLKSGPLPSIGVTRYAVIQGIPQKQFTTPLLMSTQADTVYRVRLDIQGDRFALSIQDHPVDSWSEPRLARGSIGFFSEKDAGSRIAGVHVRGQYDMLGRLCAFLMPPSISNYR